MTFTVGAQILTYGSTWDEALDLVAAQLTAWRDRAGAVAARS